MTPPDDDHHIPRTRSRFDPDAWLRGLTGHPADIAQQLEFLSVLGDDAMERLLSAVEVGSLRLVRASRASLPWMLPQKAPPYGRTTTLHTRFAAHLAAALGLAARSDGPTARHIRATLREFLLPPSAPWWLPDSLEGFTALTSLRCHGPWHPAAIAPRRLLCLPKLDELYLDGAKLGDRRLASTAWHLPVVTRISLSNNDLTTMPEALLALDTLETLHLLDNPIREVPAALADPSVLPKLRYLDLRRTPVRSLPARFTTRPGLHIQRSS